VHRGEITAEVAARLVAGQFPRWANLPVVQVKLNGWDNTTFRLGDELSIRLPSADEYSVGCGSGLRLGAGACVGARDVTGSTLLVTDGALHAVIDFGCAAVGDPACDLVMEWTFFSGDSAAVFRRGLRLDEATWARGWRYGPRQIAERVIAGHFRSAGS
jgi:aminoglycoside phosphotransferase (APT) family kinase protein